ncbi:MAG: SDR family NAD(P)-dependent oxidoreductase [Vicinamibacterales bacterium]
MELSGHTVLITGGASGIGLALARRLARAGSTVVTCGRRAQALAAAREAIPGLVTRVCDLSNPAERETLAAWVTDEYPALDVLVNNAGIQRYPRLAEPEPWPETATELAINLEAPIHLTRLLLPHLASRPRAAVVNVTSGLAIIPLARAPIYSATKAALRSFTATLRHQLAGTPVEVIELLPPAVDTDLGGPGLHTFGVPVDEFADAAIAGLERGDHEIAYGFADQARRASRAEIDAGFARLNAAPARPASQS